MCIRDSLGAFLSGACLSSPANDYLYTCANGQSCPTGTSCASDNLCHPVYVAGAGPADAGAYLSLIHIFVRGF